MSSPGRKARSTVNQQMKAGLNAVKDFLSGRSGEAKIDDGGDQATREVVAAELLAAMSGQSVVDQNSPMPSATDTQEIPRFETDSTTPETTTEENLSSEVTEEVIESGNAPDPTEQDQSDSSLGQEQERARQLFLDHGYFDEAVEKLGSDKPPAERAAAARALGLFGSQRGTPHLIAAMFDDDPEVRSAAEEALAQISDPTVAAAEVSEAPEAASEPRLPVPGVEVSEAAPMKPASVAIESIISNVDEIEAVANVAGSEATDAENQLLEEEQTIRGTVEQLGKELLETIAAIKESENEVQWRLEREGQLRDEAAERRREQEELRQQAAAEAEMRRAQEREAIGVEQAARKKAESEAERQAELQTSLRFKVVRLRLAGEELASRRTEMETARLQAGAAAREVKAARARDEAKLQHEAALKRLHNEEAAL
ncbi:MAG TPA: HEAT repeat domain-containing protein, partial [Pyrinomonadaceae bacterium]|nr:HEAT repeat domain-containing protein [Pyrinomonadaceae bacterium]